MFARFLERLQVSTGDSFPQPISFSVVNAGASRPESTRLLHKLVVRKLSEMANPHTHFELDESEACASALSRLHYSSFHFIAFLPLNFSLGEFCTILWQMAVDMHRAVTDLLAASSLSDDETDGNGVVAASLASSSLSATTLSASGGEESLLSELNRRETDGLSFEEDADEGTGPLSVAESEERSTGSASKGSTPARFTGGKSSQSRPSHLSEAEARVAAIGDIVANLAQQLKAGKIASVDLASIRSQTARKYRLSHAPKLVEILAAVPPDHRSALAPLLRAKPVRTASGIAVVAVMSKPHRCPHIATTGNICVYCPGGPDSDFEYSTQSYTGYEPTSMRAIRARSAGETRLACLMSNIASTLRRLP